MRRTTAFRMRLWAIFGAVVIVATGLVPAAAATAADTSSTLPRAFAPASASQFNAGNIISNDQFYQTGAMTASEIQAFLDAKIGSCSNTNCLNVYFAKTEKRTNDRNICTGYTPDSDALERVSTIIYKVQQACGISAKVILVTLQKEQGLITHSGPTTGRLAAAMGWLCPDTAPCSGGGASLFRQIYGGAWQLKRYNTPDYFGNYHVGTYSIKYNPNSSCGTKTVTIKNDATAALYNYTPYTPNSAALANLYGAAPPCGSYGNRNFWVYYSDWFGNPTTGDGLANVAAEYAEAGGPTGPLGAALGAGTCTRSVYSCFQNYEHGVVYWSSSFGAFAVSGVFGDYYLESGGVAGPLGPPSTDYHTLTGPNGGGNTQKFANGMIYSGPPGMFSILGEMNTAYGDSGWVRGAMGWPTAERACSSARCTQPTQTGTIYGTATAAAALDVALDATYRAAGGPAGVLGWPTTNVADIDTGANGTGRTMRTTGGMLYETTSGGFAVTGRMQSAFEAAGWVRGVMGWPTSTMSCTLPSSGCVQQFQHGDIYMPKTGTAYAISNEGIADSYRDAGGPASLGWPVTSTTKIDTGTGGPGFVQAFSSGAYIYSHSGSVVLLSKKYQAVYKAAGGVRGVLGWPSGAPDCTLPAGGCRIPFENGTLYQPATGTGYVISDDGIADAYAAMGGVTSALGWPKTSTKLMVTTTNGQGHAQGFAGGYLYSSVDGAFAVTTVAQAGFANAGGVRGALGWPTANAVCNADGCTQAFQHGVLYIPNGGAAFAISDSAIAEYYDGKGGPTGELGYPTTSTTLIVTTSNGRGYVQGFTGGYIYATTAGTFSVMAPMQTKLKAAGWVRGALGFPIADAVCTTTCTQQFQHGTLSTP